MLILYRVYREGSFILQTHAEDEDDAIATAMHRTNQPLLQSFDGWTAEVAETEKKHSFYISPSVNGY
jgi:hypothetical protein